jgi:hypothetical protein
MPEYDVYLMRTVSQSIKVEADSLPEAAQRAIEESDLEPNVTNKFEADGDIEVFSIKDGDTVVWDSEKDPTSTIWQ